MEKQVCFSVVLRVPWVTGADSRYTIRGCVYISCHSRKVLRVIPFLRETLRKQCDFRFIFPLDSSGLFIIIFTVCFILIICSFWICFHMPVCRSFVKILLGCVYTGVHTCIRARDPHSMLHRWFSLSNTLSQGEHSGRQAWGQRPVLRAPLIHSSMSFFFFISHLQNTI